MSKEKAILEYVVRWLDSNIDEPPPEGVQEDSAARQRQWDNEKN